MSSRAGASCVDGVGAEGAFQQPAGDTRTLIFDPNVAVSSQLGQTQADGRAGRAELDGVAYKADQGFSQQGWASLHPAFITCPLLHFEADSAGGGLTAQPILYLLQNFLQGTGLGWRVAQLVVQQGPNMCATLQLIHLVFEAAQPLPDRIRVIAVTRCRRGVEVWPWFFSGDRCCRLAGKRGTQEL